MSTEITTPARQSLVPFEMSELSSLAAIIFESALTPDAIKSKQDAAILVMTGNELGLSPMQSLRSIHVVKGKPVLSADTMVALCKRSPVCASWRVVEASAERVTITTTRQGDEPETLTWTMQDAKRAGLGGDNWRKYPRAMLRARCSAELARQVYPDVVGGIYDPDEDEVREDAPQSTVPTRIIDATQPDAAPAPKALPEPVDLRSKLSTLTVEQYGPVAAFVVAILDQVLDDELPTVASHLKAILTSRVPADRLTRLLTELGGYSDNANAQDEYLAAVGHYLAHTTPDPDGVLAAWNALAPLEQWPLEMAMAKDAAQIAVIGSRLMGDAE